MTWQFAHKTARSLNFVRLGFVYTTWADNRLADAAHAHQPDVRFAKIALAGATHFSVTLPSSSTAGSALSLTVSALDANNNRLSETAWSGSGPCRSASPGW